MLTAKDVYETYQEEGGAAALQTLAVDGVITLLAGGAVKVGTKVYTNRAKAYAAAKKAGMCVDGKVPERWKRGANGRLPSPNSFDDLISSSIVSGRTGSTRQFNRNGGLVQANADFDALSPNNVRSINVSSGGVGRVGTLPDGRTIIVRESSRGIRGQSGPPTIEVQGGSGGGLNARFKIRY